jgi:hypothetical protein
LLAFEKEPFALLIRQTALLLTLPSVSASPCAGSNAAELGADRNARLIPTRDKGGAEEKRTSKIKNRKRKISTIP